ncbi:MAG: hypothetical protein ACK5L3_05125 [Oscillospiraceae bacterium]
MLAQAQLSLPKLLSGSTLHLHRQPLKRVAAADMVFCWQTALINIATSTFEYQKKRCTMQTISFVNWQCFAW